MCSSDLEIESAWLPPCMVLIINDNLYGLMFALIYICRCVHLHASSDIHCGPLRLDTKASKATVDGTALKLTSHEYRLLAYLMHHKDEIVSRTELIEHLYDQDFDRDSNTIEVFVGRLRRKIGVDLIETVRGLGYRMRDETAGA